MIVVNPSYFCENMVFLYDLMFYKENLRLGLETSQKVVTQLKKDIPRLDIYIDNMKLGSETTCMQLSLDKARCMTQNVFALPYEQLMTILPPDMIVCQSKNCQHTIYLENNSFRAVTYLSIFDRSSLQQLHKIQVTVQFNDAQKHVVFVFTSLT